MTGVNTWDIVAANNVLANIGYTWDEGMAPGAVNNSARAVLADVRSMANDLIWFQYGKGAGPYTPVYVGATQYKIAGVDVSTAYHVGRRTKVTGSSTGTIYGTINTVAFSTDTTVTVTWDSGSLSNEAFTAVYLSQIPATGFPVQGLKVTAGKVLTVSNNITLAATDGSVPFTLPTQQKLTSGSAATYTTPANCRQIKVKMVGAGGGGGGTGTSSTAGGAGGNTIFNSYNATGGSGGGPASAATGGAGGSGGSNGSGATSVNRQVGQSGAGSTVSIIAANAGPGGSSQLGPGAQGSAGGAGSSATANTGGGGQGGNGNGTVAPTASGGGGEFVELIINSPSATYTYTIGAAGSAGAAGTSGTNGGTGGTGVIIVDEFY